MVSGGTVVESPEKPGNKRTGNAWTALWLGAELMAGMSRRSAGVNAGDKPGRGGLMAGAA